MRTTGTRSTQSTMAARHCRKTIAHKMTIVVDDDSSSALLDQRDYNPSEASVATRRIPRSSVGDVITSPRDSRVSSRAPTSAREAYEYAIADSDEDEQDSQAKRLRAYRPRSTSSGDTRSGAPLDQQPASAGSLLLHEKTTQEKKEGDAPMVFSRRSNPVLTRVDSLLSQQLNSVSARSDASFHTDLSSPSLSSSTINEDQREAGLFQRTNSLQSMVSIRSPEMSAFERGRLRLDAYEHLQDNPLVDKADLDIERSTLAVYCSEGYLKGKGQEKSLKTKTWDEHMDHQVNW